jgi:hypothetical protein
MIIVSLMALWPTGLVAAATPFYACAFPKAAERAMALTLQNSHYSLPTVNRRRAREVEAT